MKAAMYEEFGQPLGIRDLPDPVPGDDGVVIRVMATGICFSDWHGWKGHDPDVSLPHVPGHELSGIIEDVGKNVSRWKPGDRVTLPFVCGCGRCPQCLSGNHQVCDHQFQPGFTHWGSFAQYVAVNHADINLVHLPDDLDFETAAVLGCRFVTAHRAVMAQGKVKAGQWVAVHGCGGVGLSAIMIAHAAGARVVGIDIRDEKLKFAESIGAEATINAARIEHVVEAVREKTRGGAHVSLDALGSAETCFNSVSCLRKRGKHIQVGLMVAEESNAPIPLARVVAHELEILGSHGIQAYQYDGLLGMITSGKLDPGRLIGRTVTLEESLKELETMDRFSGVGIAVINRF